MKRRDRGCAAARRGQEQAGDESALGHGGRTVCATRLRFQHRQAIRGWRACGRSARRCRWRWSGSTPRGGEISLSPEAAVRAAGEPGRSAAHPARGMPRSRRRV